MYKFNFTRLEDFKIENQIFIPYFNYDSLYLVKGVSNIPKPILIRNSIAKKLSVNIHYYYILKQFSLQHFMN